MLQITLVAAGDFKESFYREAAAEYEKRLSPFCKLQTRIVSTERLPANPGRRQIEQALCAEGERMLRACARGGRLIALCVEGRQMDSVRFSAYLHSFAAAGCSRVNFVIGSSHGLSDAVKQAAQERISFSPMTFPHALARVMLLEQLYRAFAIEAGGSYHK